MFQNVYVSLVSDHKNDGGRTKTALHFTRLLQKIITEVPKIVLFWYNKTELMYKEYLTVM